MKKIIIALILGLMSVVGLSAPKNSPWKEIQTVVIPQNTEIHEGVTRNGNPKFWIEIEDVQVAVSPSNADKFQKGEVKLELVKWENTENGKFKYSTRQVKGSSTKKESKNIDLGRVFK